LQLQNDTHDWRPAAHAGQQGRTEILLKGRVICNAALVSHSYFRLEGLHTYLDKISKCKSSVYAALQLITTAQDKSQLLRQDWDACNGITPCMHVNYMIQLSNAVVVAANVSWTF